jgi:DNA-binding XRE family transcriptional regulator
MAHEQRRSPKDYYATFPLELADDLDIDDAEFDMLLSYMDIVNELIAVRARRRWSIKMLAEKSGVSTATVERMEKGEVWTEWPSLWRIGRAMKVMITMDADSPLPKSGSPVGRPTPSKRPDPQAEPDT